VLELPSQRLEVALEVDAGTIAPSLVAKRMAKYEARRMMRTPVFGLADPLVFLVAVTPRRARSLARALRGSSVGGGVVLLGSAPYVLADGGVRSGAAASITTLAEQANALTAADFGVGLLSFTATGRVLTSVPRATPRSP
jgi:hypothetical protein